MAKKGSITTTGYIKWEDFLRLQDELLMDKKLKEYLLITLGVCMALRISDLLRLRWADILGDQVTLIEKKTGKKRIVKLPENVQRIILSFFMVNRLNIEDHVFLSSRATIYTREGINKMLKRIFSVYNINCTGNISSHLFRKTFGRRVIERGDDSTKSLILLMDTFNHSSPQTTKRYLGIRQDEINNLYESIW